MVCQLAVATPLKPPIWQRQRVQFHREGGQNTHIRPCHYVTCCSDGLWVCWSYVTTLIRPSASMRAFFTADNVSMPCSRSVLLSSSSVIISSRMFCHCRRPS